MPARHRNGVRPEGRRRQASESAKVVRVSLDEPLRTIEVEHRYTSVYLVVVSEGAVIAEIALPATDALTPEHQKTAITRSCGETMWRRHLASLFLEAAGGTPLASERRV